MMSRVDTHMNDTIRLPEEGDEMIDTGTPEDKIVTVIEVADETASEYHIESLDMTVAEYNRCDEDTPVIMAHYGGRNEKPYAFPLSRLQWPEEDDG